MSSRGGKRRLGVVPGWKGEGRRRHDQKGQVIATDWWVVDLDDVIGTVSEDTVFLHGAPVGTPVVMQVAGPFEHVGQAYAELHRLEAAGA